MHYIYRETTQFSFHFKLKENGCALYSHKHLHLPCTYHCQTTGTFIMQSKSPVVLTEFAYVYTNQLNTLFYPQFIELRYLYMFRASTAHHQEVRCMYVGFGSSKMSVSTPPSLVICHLTRTICHIHTPYLLMMGC
jgi:hypothetical protein